MTVNEIMGIADAYERSLAIDRIALREKLIAAVGPLCSAAAAFYPTLERAERSEQEAAELRKDAERYRWLRDGEAHVVQANGRTASLWFDYKRGSEVDEPLETALPKDRAALDSAIDAAMREGK